MDKKVHFLSKTDGSWTKKLISSQKPTVLGQKSSFPLKNQRFWGKKVHFLSETNGSWAKKSISSQKPTVLGQKSSFPLKNQRFWGKKVHFLSKTDGSWAKKFISSQKLTVLEGKGGKEMRVWCVLRRRGILFPKNIVHYSSLKNLSLKKDGSQISFFFLTTKNGI